MILTTTQAAACLSTAVILGGFVNIDFTEEAGHRVEVTFYVDGATAVRQLRLSTGATASEMYETREAFSAAHGVAS
jgi:hypothetical protein